MKNVERFASIGAALSALATLACCLPMGIAAAAATASAALVFAALRPWLLGISIVLLLVGFVQTYRRRDCARSRTSVAVFWISVAIVVVIIFFPQLVATALASSPPAQQPLITMTSLDRIKAEFNRSADSTRIILLLSPS